MRMRKSPKKGAAKRGSARQPDVGDGPEGCIGIREEVMNARASADDRLVEGRRTKCLIVVHDIRLLDDDLDAFGQVELTILQRRQRIVFRVRIMHQVEAGRSERRRSKDPALVGVDTKNEPDGRHLIIARGDVLYQRREWNGDRNHLDPDLFPGLLHVGKLLFVLRKTRRIFAFETELLPVLIEESVAVSVGPPGIGKKLLRLRGIEFIDRPDLIRLVCWRRHRLRSVRAAAIAEHDRLDYQVSIDSIHERLAHFEINKEVQLGGVLIGREETESECIENGQRNLRIRVLQGVDLRCFDVCDVGFTGFQGLERRRRISYDPVDVRVDVDRKVRLVPVIRIFRHGDMIVLNPLDKFEGARTDDAGRVSTGRSRIGAPTCERNFLPDVPGDDRHLTDRLVEEGCDWGVCNELNRVIVDRAVAFEDAQDIAAPGAEAFLVDDGIECEYDVGGGEWGSIMPLDSGVEMEQIGDSIRRDLP